MPLPKDVRFVTFDCYGTLIDWELGAYDAFQKEADRDGFTIDRAALAPLFVNVQREIERGSYELYAEVLRRTAVRVAKELDWNTEAIPDGNYLVRVVASDERSNPREDALDAELVSPPYLVDNRRPEVVGLAVDGQTVGYLARELAAELQPALRALAARGVAVSVPVYARGGFALDEGGRASVGLVLRFDPADVRAAASG